MKLYELKKDKKKNVVSWIDEQFKDHRLRMADTYRSWMLNLAWVRGYQNTDFNISNHRFATQNNKEPWRVRLISNIMLPIVRRIVAQLTYIKPIWDTIPATADQTDIEIAEKSTKVLIDTWQRVGMNQKLLRLLTWQANCGSAFLKTGWDHDLGNEYEIEANTVEEQTLTEYLQFMGIEVKPETIKANKGDIFVDVVTPFNITFDPNVPVMSESDWIIESQLRTKDWVINKYGKKFENVTETSGVELFLYPNIQNYTDRASTSLQKNGVLVHELFIRRCKQFKDGLHCVIVGDKLAITPQKHPYDHGELPYGHFIEIFDPAHAFGTCVAEQIRPNQARYNRISSGIMEQVNQMSKVQWLKPKTAGNITFTNRPGGVIEYAGNVPPSQVNLAPIPAYVENLLTRTRADVQDTASSHDVSEGKNEPGVRSGKAVESLQDADNTILNPTLTWMDEELSRIGRLALQTIIQFTDTARMVEIEGQFNEPDIFSFTGEDLKGKSSDCNYFKVRVKTYGRQILSRSGRENMVRTMMDLQLLNPQIHREQILHMLGTADIVTMHDQGSMDRTRQWREIQTLVKFSEQLKDKQLKPEQLQQLMQQVPVKVYTGQNHLVHIESVHKFIASSHWDKLDELQKQIVIQHLSEHMRQQVFETIYPQVQAAQIMGTQNGTGSQTGSNTGSK